MQDRILTIRFRCKSLEESPVLGKISDEFLEAVALEFFKLYFTQSDEIKPEEGDFYSLSPISANIEEGGWIPTDRETVIEDFKRWDVPLTEENIIAEIRTRQLENEGLTRSDAQGVADAEIRSGKLKVEDENHVQRILRRGTRHSHSSRLR